MLKNLWERWKAIARAIGVFNSRVILTVIYFTVVAAFALAYKLVSDPLGVKTRVTTWKERTGPLNSLEEAKRQ